MIELCTDETYLVKSPSHAMGAIIMIALYVVIEAACILSTVRLVMKGNLKEDKVLILIMSMLNAALIFRIIYFLGGMQPFCYPMYWYYYFADMASLCKDICLLSLLIRVWEYLSSFEKDGAYKQHTLYTYVFMALHFFGGYVFILVEDSEAADDLLFHYLGGVQIIMFASFGYGFYKLFTTIRSNPDAKVEREVLVLNAISVLVIITLLARIIYNLVVRDFETDGQTNDIVSFVFNAFSELLPCALVTLLLFFQQQDLKESVLQGSTFEASKD